MPVARPFALTMPIVTVWPTPSGLPSARTTSPTCTWSESPERQGLQVLGVDLQHGEIARRVRADDVCLHAAAVTQFHAHLVGAVDDVVVRQHVAIRPDDHARAEPALATLGIGARPAEAIAEELPEQRIVRQVLADRANALLRSDRDDGRHDAVHERGVGVTARANRACGGAGGGRRALVAPQRRSCRGHLPRSSPRANRRAAARRP